ncbi:MAG: hypothetical protein R2724_34785 [Bryobacterales bacterium]
MGLGIARWAGAPEQNNGTASMCDDDGDWGIRLTPTLSANTIIGKSFSVSSVSHVQWVAKVHVLQDDSTIGMRVIQKNSAGTIVYTTAESVTLDSGVYSVTLESAVSSSATQLIVQVAGMNALSDFWLDRLDYNEIQPPEDGDCDEKAEARRVTIYNACYADDGIPTGNCVGAADPTMAGGCRIDCITTCNKTQIEDPADLQCLGS